MPRALILPPLLPLNTLHLPRLRPLQHLRPPRLPYHPAQLVTHIHNHAHRHQKERDIRPQQAGEFKPVQGGCDGRDGRGGGGGEEVVEGGKEGGGCVRGVDEGEGW